MSDFTVLVLVVLLLLCFGPLGWMFACAAIFNYILEH
jgi:hypothetical protein